MYLLINSTQIRTNVLAQTILYSHVCAVSRGVLNLSIFSERLAQLRDQKGISQTAAARELEIGSRTYQYYEKGEREPQLSTLVRMADFYGVTLDYLAGRTDQ